MRRFSQRSALVTLSEINITPLLDLAFVLLIIFVITTPLLEQGLSLNLPKGGEADRQLEKSDIRTIEISPRGEYMLNRQRMSIDQLEAQLARDYKFNPNLVVYIRADELGLNKDTYEVINRCIKNGITSISFRTKPPK